MTDFPHTEKAPGKEQKEPWEEAWETDFVDALGWAALFAWGALVVLATYTSFHERFDSWDGWIVFWLGAAGILFVETAVRLAMPTYRSKWWWTFLWAVGVLSVALGSLYSWAWLALLLMAVAIVILAGALRTTSRRES